MAPIGVSAQEKKQGSNISITVGIKYDFSKSAQTDNLNDTLDYEQVYQTISKIVALPANLLENVGYRIIKSLFKTIPPIKAIDLTVSKISPPISGKCERASIKIKAKREGK